MNVCVTCVPGTHRGQKWALDALELKLQMFVRHYLGVGNQTLVL